MQEAVRRGGCRCRCAEDVLAQLRYDPEWLLQIQVNEDGRYVVQDPQRGARSRGAAIQASVGGGSGAQAAAAAVATDAPERATSATMGATPRLPAHLRLRVQRPPGACNKYSPAC